MNNRSLPLLSFSLCLGIFLGLTSFAGSDQAGHRLKAIQSYAVYYGSWTSDKIQASHQYDLIIAHPGKNLSNLTPEIVQKIRQGKDRIPYTDDDVLVYGYVSLGEDENMPRGPRELKLGFQGPVSRGSFGRLHYAHKGFPDWAVDERALDLNEKGQKIWSTHGLPRSHRGQDGLPDENGKWGSYFVYLGDPLWQAQIIQKARFLVEETGCDGLFLDTVDTVSPWGDYAWMQEDAVRLLELLRLEFPKTGLILNRGLFLFDKYSDRLGPILDGVLFESFLSEWNWFDGRAERHRWFKANQELLRDSVGPMAVKYGVRMFFLHYIDPHQKDAPRFFYQLGRQLKSTGGLHFISHPGLQGFPKVQYKKRSFGSEKSELNTRFEDHFWWVDLSDWYLSDDQSIVLIRKDSKDIDSHVFEPVVRQGNFLRLPDLPPGKETFHIGLIDSMGGELKAGEVVVTYPKTQRLNAPDKIQIKPMEDGLLIRWKSVRGATGYQLEWGDELHDLNRKIQVPSGVSYQWTGLISGQTVYFSIVAKREDGLGYPSDVFRATVLDSSPPNAPVIETWRVGPDSFYIQWSPILDDQIAGYALYVDPVDLGQGLPIKIPANKDRWLMRGLAPGDYVIRLTAMDMAQNESESAQEIEINISD